MNLTMPAGGVNGLTRPAFILALMIASVRLVAGKTTALAGSLSEGLADVGEFVTSVCEASALVDAPAHTQMIAHVNAMANLN